MAQQQQHQAIAERDQLARQLATTQTRLRVVQQNASTIAAAPPVPPKNFYSQKQKDELADLIEALVSQLDRCDAEIVQIISAPDFPPAPCVMGSMTFHTLQQQVDVMTAGADKIQKIADTCARNSRDLVQKNGFYRAELMFLGADQIPDEFFDIERDARGLNSNLKIISQLMAKYPDDGDLTKIVFSSKTQNM